MTLAETRVLLEKGAWLLHLIDNETAPAVRPDDVVAV